MYTNWLVIAFFHIFQVNIRGHIANKNLATSSTACHNVLEFKDSLQSTYTIN